MALALALALLAAAAATTEPSRDPTVFSVYSFGAAGDGVRNDTGAVQAALDAAAKAGRGVAWLPANGTYLFGGGVAAFGHGYDGVTLQLDGAVTVPKPATGAAGVWPACQPGCKCAQATILSAAIVRSHLAVSAPACADTLRCL